jgi:hypothetical protein
MITDRLLNGKGVQSRMKVSLKSKAKSYSMIGRLRVGILMVIKTV